MTCKRMFALCATLLLTGCMPKMTIEEMKAMQPQRPPELDQLNDFVGEWETDGEMKFSFLDEPIKGTGSGKFYWAGNKWFIVGESTFDMGELGKMTGHETWTYDAHTKRYRSTWVDSMGGTGVGEGRYDANTRTWKMKATAHSPFGTSTMNGHAHFIDDDTMEWTWNEYMLGGLMKTAAMKGTTRRK